MPTVLVQWIPVIIQFATLIWFLAKMDSKQRELTDKHKELVQAERETQASLSGALREISRLAQQVAVNDVQRLSIGERLTASETEMRTLRSRQHELANEMAKLIAQSDALTEIRDSISELRERVERMADRFPPSTRQR